MIEFDLPPPLPEPPPAPPPPDADIPQEAFGARQAANLMPETVDDPLYRREAATANATRAEELNNDFIGRQREILQTGPDAFYNRQGRDAILAAPETIGRLNAAQDEVLSQATTLSQRAMLSKILDNHTLVTHYGIGSHVGRQSLEWQKGVAQARLDQLHAQARLDYGDQASIANYAEAGEAAARDHARLSGLPSGSDEAQARAAGARSAIYRTAIESALEANDNRAASTLHEQVQDDLTPADAAVLKPQLKAAAEIETARDYLGKITLPSSEPAAYFDAPRLMAEVDTAHQAATEQNNTDWADNPMQRATNQHHIDVQFGLRKRGIEQTKVQLDGKVTDWLSQPTPDGQPQISRPPLALWTQLGPEQQQSVDAVLAQNARGTNITDNGASNLIGSPSITLEGAVRASDSAPTTADRDIQIAQLAEPPQQPNAPPGTRLPERQGKPVVLPDGSHIPDRYSPSGHLMAPVGDLAPVAAAGRHAGAIYRRMMANGDPVTVGLAQAFLVASLGVYLGHAGLFDYQREGSVFTKYEQFPQFRNVSNVNVGLFCQQAGLPLEVALSISGAFAMVRSRNWDPKEPYSLDPRTAEFIRLGYELGRSGKFNVPSSR